MDIQKELDKAIRDFEKENCDIESGYETEGSPKRENYLSNAAWNKFYDDMARYNMNAFKRYSDGAGGEMRQGKNGTPPKMASFGSSSRMIYNLVMKDEVKERFLFEEKLATTIGGEANLDGFMQKGNTYIFVEAKCREPYATKQNDIKDVYRPLYAEITKSPDVDLVCDCGESNDKNEMKVTFKLGDQIINHFDMKQMICHLLAVGTAVLTNHYKEMENTKDEDIKLHFIYLIYDPQNLKFSNNNSGKEIVRIYNEIFDFCKGNENQFFKNLFKVVLEFLQSEKKLGTDKNILKIVDNFNFCICSQENFKEKCQSLLN
ncbi:MAG: hypothetical protein IKU15_05315 [Clostridia bacterium]|nr:hypothetical protein [Clostridia bacterium]